MYICLYYTKQAFFLDACRLERSTTLCTGFRLLRKILSIEREKNGHVLRYTVESVKICCI